MANIKSVCVGRIQRTQHSDLEDAVLMLEEIGDSSVLVAVLVSGAIPCATLWDFKIEPERGAFSI